MLRKLFQRLFTVNMRPGCSKVKISGYSRQLRIESLEDRRVLSTSNVVFLFDETESSNSFQEDWLIDIVAQLDNSLDQVGISSRQYGLVGYGDDESSERAHSHVVDPSPSSSDPLFGSASQLSTAATTLNNEFEQEDGWDAIEHAVAEYNFDPGAAVLFVLIQNTDGRSTAPNRTLTELGVLASMESHNISLTTVVEASFDADMFAATGGVVYGVEADETDGNVNNQHTAYVDNAITNNGLPAEVFSDEAEGGPHDINGSSSDFSETDNAYVRLGWQTGGSAWNIDVVRQGQYAAANTVAADRLAEFNDFFVDSLTDQVTSKIATGDVAHLDVPLLEINFGGPAMGDFIADTDPSLGANFLASTAASIAPSPAPTILPNGNSVAEGVPLDIFQTLRPGNPDVDVNLHIPSALVPDGSYTVELLFAYLEDPELLKFDIFLEGTPGAQGEELLSGYFIDNDFAKINPVNTEQELSTSRLSLNEPTVKRFQVDVVNGLDVLLKPFMVDLFGGEIAGLSGLRILKTAPKVTEVVISNSSTSATHSYFDAVRDTSQVLGNQLRALTFSEADTIAITFSEPVTLSPTGSELELRSILAPSAYGTVYVGANAAGTTHTWELDPNNAQEYQTFGQNTTTYNPDQILLILSDDIQAASADQAALDGEWINPNEFNPSVNIAAISRFPSGDGVAGGEFRFVFTTFIPGDFDNNNYGSWTDIDIVMDNWGALESTIGWTTEFAGTDGLIGQDELNLALASLGINLRSAELFGDLDENGIINMFDFWDLLDLDMSGSISSAEATLLANAIWYNMDQWFATNINPDVDPNS